jgi:hypothetical protein
MSVATTFNLLMLGSLVAAAYAMFLYALKRSGDAGGAFIAGLVFGFSPFMTARATAHFSLVQAAPLPIFGLLLYQIFQGPTTRLEPTAGLVVAWAIPLRSGLCRLLPADVHVRCRVLGHRSRTAAAVRSAGLGGGPFSICCCSRWPG